VTIQHAANDSVPHLKFRRSRLRRPAGLPNDLEAADGQIDALRQALAREEILLREKDALVLEQQTLRGESDHRLFNGLQMVVSLLSLQSRAAPTPETAAQLSKAALRVAAIERIHRRLHKNDGTQSVTFKKYLEDFCSDFSGIMKSQNDGEIAIRVESMEVMFPTEVAIPLGFIVNELLTNAVKYGTGNTRVTLDRYSGGGHVLTVANAGPAMPQDYDPASSTGLGMKIIQSFTQKIGGRLIFARDEGGQGARISVLFS
jgi:two-component system, sensor histidine kinase PdtaS